MKFCIAFQTLTLVCILTNQTVQFLSVVCVYYSVEIVHTFKHFRFSPSSSKLSFRFRHKDMPCLFGGKDKVSLPMIKKKRPRLEKSKFFFIFIPKHPFFVVKP